MLTLANVIWGARCGKSARRVLPGETNSSGHVHSVRGARESAALRQAPHGLPPARFVSTTLFELWVQALRQKRAHGDVIVVRYADDIVVGFNSKADADEFLAVLTARMRMVNLDMHTVIM